MRSLINVLSDDELMYLNNKTPEIIQKLLNWQDEVKAEIKEAKVTKPRSNIRVSVAKLSAKGEVVERYVSISEAGKINNIHNNDISDCVNGRKDLAGGFKWKKIDPIKKCCDCGQLKSTDQYYKYSGLVLSACKPCRKLRRDKKNAQ